MTWWQILLDNFIEFAIGIVVLVIPFLIKKLVQVIERKWKVDIDNKVVENINDYVEKAILYAERWARNELKAGRKPKGEDKLAVALKFIFDALEESGIERKGRDYLVGLIEAQLEKIDGKEKEKKKK